MKASHKNVRTFLLCGAAIITAYATLLFTRVTIGGALHLLDLSIADAVIATTTAEAVARIIACGVIAWKLSAVLAEAEDARAAWELVRTRAMLFGLALFATLFMAMDQRVFWWVQYVSGGMDFSRAAQTVHQSAFTAFVVNCVTLLLFHFKTWRGYSIAFAWLSFVTAGGFVAALWWRGLLQ